MARIGCPQCNYDDFTRNDVDHQVYVCDRCGMEVTVFTENQGILTKTQKEFLERSNVA